MIRLLNGFETTFLDYPDNESLAVIVCMLGCDNCCKGCQNPDLKDYMYNKGLVKEYTPEEFVNELKIACERNLTNKVVFSGGDCLSSFNVKSTKQVLNLLNNEYDVCLYTGHSVDYVKTNEVKNFKYVKCGHFDLASRQESMKTDDFIQFASPNQALYDSQFNLLSENGRYYFN